MKFLNLLPHWAQPVFKEAGLELEFEELKMNCSACTFARGDVRDGSAAVETFAADLKCCTFFPNLANFAAGIELFRKPSIFDNLLAQPGLSLPLGIVAPDSYKTKYSAANFGTSEELLCPHYDRSAQNCGIWKSRPSSCVRFVCRSSLGELGQGIWAETEVALNSLEMNLAYEAALQLGLVNYEIHAKTWKASADEKKNFYLAAAVYVNSLSASQKIDLAGEEFAQASSQIQALRAASSNLALRAAAGLDSPSGSIMIASRS